MGTNVPIKLYNFPTSGLLMTVSQLSCPLI